MLADFLLCDMLGAMRYRLHINRMEFLAAFIPVVDGAMKVLSPGSVHGSGVFHRYVVPGALLAVPLLLLLQYLFGYVELTPSSLEYQALWKHRSIPYYEIEQIAQGRLRGKPANSSVIEVYAVGAKKLSLRVDRREQFLSELQQYAPRASFQDLVAK